MVIYFILLFFLKNVIPPIYLVCVWVCDDNIVLNVIFKKEKERNVFPSSKDTKISMMVIKNLNKLIIALRYLDAYTSASPSNEYSIISRNHSIFPSIFTSFVRSKSDSTRIHGRNLITKLSAFIYVLNNNNVWNLI